MIAQRDKRIINIIFFLILFLGLVLRFYQYLMGRSLWEDETHLALNFMKYGYLRLMEPLDHIQGAPIFFIFGVKTFTKLFGFGELAFRALPFIASILTLPLFYYIIADLTKSKITALLGFLIFSVNVVLIYFSTELKQYAVDVSVYLLMIFVAVSSNGYVAKNRNLILMIAGCISILFSSVAFIVLFSIACNMALNWWKEKKIDLGHIKILVAWLIVFVINYFLFIHNHPSTAEQRFNYSFAFCPTDIMSCEFVSFMNKTIDETFFYMLLLISKEYGFSYILLFIFFVAIRNIILKKKYTVFFYVCLPVLLHLGLSMLKLYPFWYRLILYLTPCFIFLMAYGTYLIAAFLAKKIHMALGVLVVVVCGFFFMKQSVVTFPMWPTEIKPALDFVNTHLPGKHIYVTNPVNAYDYYYQTGYVKNPIHKRLPWKMTPSEYYKLVSEETSNYILFYGQEVQFEYGDVIKDIEKRNLVASHFEYKGFALSEVRPLREDSHDIVAAIDYTGFDTNYTVAADKLIAIYGGTIVSKPVLLKKGKYSISVMSRGTPAAQEYPRLSVFINNEKIGVYNATAEYEPARFYYELKEDAELLISFALDNDAFIGNEDRNGFIKNIVFYKIEN